MFTIELKAKKDSLLNKYISCCCVFFFSHRSHVTTARFDKRQTCDTNLFRHCAMPECWDYMVK